MNTFLEKLSVLAVVVFLAAIIYFGVIQVKSVNYAADANDTAYTPRYVTNIEVKNYNIVGKSVSYYDKMPQKALVVGENIIETFAALGIEDKILCAVGYGNPFFQPEPQLEDIYKKIDVQKYAVLNPENVMKMQPDLIVAGQSVFSEKQLRSTAFWNERNIHTFCSLNANSPGNRSHIETLEQEYEFILGLGKIFDCEEKAKRIVAAMQNDIKNINSLTEGREKPKVMIVEQLGGAIVVYDDKKLAGNICSKLNAEVASSSGGTIGLEDLLKADPDVLFVVKSGGDPEAAADVFRNMQALKSMKCIKNKRVYGILLNYTYNSAVKTAVGIKKFAAGIYPDLADKI